MDPSDQDIVDFQAAYEIDFGEEISADEAREMLARLTRFCKLVATQLPNAAEARYRVE